MHLLVATLFLASTGVQGEEVSRSISEDGSLQLMNTRVVKDEALQGMRGGLRIAGLDMRFGASLRTMVDGQPVLHTQVVFTGGEAGPAVSFANQQASAAARAEQSAGLTLPGLEGAVHATFSDERGATATVHQVSQSRLVSIVATRASGRHISHRVDLSVDIENFSRFQQLSRASHLARDIGPNLSR